MYYAHTAVYTLSYFYGTTPESLACTNLNLSRYVSQMYVMFDDVTSNGRTTHIVDTLDDGTGT